MLRVSHLKLSLVVFALTVMASIPSACAKTPPNLSPAAATAFQNTRIIKGLDLLRDTAIDAEAQVPPLLSTDTTRKVVMYHRSALLVIDAIGDGWQTTLTTGLDELVANLPPTESTLLAPYVSLARTLIEETR